MKIFVATGNQDKFARMKGWIDDGKYKWMNPKDLSSELEKRTKVTNEEEEKMGTMEERAIGKAAKAAEALTDYDDMLILAMDDTGYFPFIDQYIINLRCPPDVFQDGKLIAKGPEKYLHGADIANHYADIVKKVASEELMMSVAEELGFDQLPEKKFMPVVWKFALAIAETGNPGSARVIANWDHIEYIQEEYLPADIPDTGYMLGKIIVGNPFDSTEKGLKTEIEPKIALEKLLKSYS